MLLLAILFVGSSLALENNFSDTLNAATTNLVLKYVTQRVDRPFALTDTLANITKNETLVNILLLSTLTDNKR